MTGDPDNSSVSQMDVEHGSESEAAGEGNGNSSDDKKYYGNPEETAAAAEKQKEDTGIIYEAVSSENNDRQQQDLPQQRGRCYRWMTRMGCGWLARFPEEWPRTFALIFGVAGPLMLLLAIALFFGYILADLEAPQEIEDNNDVIATRAAIAHIRNFQRNITTEIPKICLALAFRNQTTDPTFQENLEEAIAEVYLRERLPFNETEESSEIPFIDGDTEQSFFDFMLECGSRAWDEVARLTDTGTTVDDLGSLSFNWIQCFSTESPNSTAFNRIMGNFLRPPQGNITRLRPDTQEAVVVQAWNRHHLALFDQYQNETITDGMTKLQQADAVREARQRAFEDADGFVGCENNSAAGAWFWFTVMTTIGYGNTAPATRGGRAMVYTLGFLSILTFAGVLANAGGIITAIFDDCVRRWKFALLQRTWAACVMWGALYYSWMVIIALCAESWKEERLGEEFLFRDAYWFSFISTTTVGLGDFYLEHGVLLRRDLMVFGLLFLVGFVFLADFLVKLTELIDEIYPRQKRDLDEALKQTDMLWHPRRNKKSKEGNGNAHAYESDTHSEENVRG